MKMIDMAYSFHM